ncbi:MAG: cysteine methyltransferase [Acidimicrobiaceae bacterium]|nr:cysteine methyltransferase [Acidimicrobiaceae bacterium]MYD07809.1 cysteine methyltransferase [Acidimicrobiaceae bacterium]MYI58901.1 cysteine methyltransferase [Acidimicrobiaceae bacterium]
MTLTGSRLSAERSNVSDRSGLTSFEVDVAAVLDQLREGEVVTYGEVAAEAGHPGAARAVGSLLSRLPDAGFCWWRVVTATGRPAPDCEQEQAERLRAEGVEVVDGRVRGLSRYA